MFQKTTAPNLQPVEGVRAENRYNNSVDINILWKFHETINTRHLLKEEYFTGLPIDCFVQHS